MRVVVAAFLLLTTPALSQPLPGECKTLEQANKQHPHHSLSKEERALKAQLQAWYRDNCKRPKIRVEIIKP